MVYLIDKDALVAEIEKRLEELNPKKGEFMGRPLRSVNPKTFPRESELEKLLLFLDTLEVKEVDLEHLEQEVKDFCYRFDDRKDKWYDMTPHDKNIMVNPTWSNFAMQLAKHFFELGLKAQKGE